MIRIYLVAGLFWAVSAALGAPEEKPKLPKEPPPRLATVIQVKEDVVVYRDFQVFPAIPKKLEPGQIKDKDTELIPADPFSLPPAPGFAVDFSLKEGEILDGEGKKLDIQTAKKRIAVGDTVLVADAGRKIDPAYLRVIKKEAVILVHPAPKPGPPLPGVPKDM
jgi:hypothetical protein